MKLEKLKTIEEMALFLSGSQAIAFAVTSNKRERYQVIEQLLRRFNYVNLTRQEKGIFIQFVIKITNYSRQQMTRILKKYREAGQVTPGQKTVNGFERRYNEADIKLLAELDKRHDTPNGFMVKKLCERAYTHFKEQAYKRLSNISVSHIYNLRKCSGYIKYRCHYEKTKSIRGANIGERRKPINNGKPGYIRIDTVHQGDIDGKKGVYHINAADEMTQFEAVVSVEKISEAFLIPALEDFLALFPFKIINFHSDNGSEYVNKVVARLLKRLLIEFTKSRPRTSNDNALAEGKNAAIIRKTYGCSHIPQYFAEKINQFNEVILNPYVNYHRPCLYPTTIVDHKGKEKKKYEYKNMMTPYEKFKSLPNASQYLQEGITFKKLNDIAGEITDNEAADLLQKQRKLLFNEIYEDSKKRA